jgi:hypothetical protein
MADEANTDFLIEFVRVGNSVKVSAIDPATGVEASIVGPANLSQLQLSRNAIAKLRYVLARKKQAIHKT